MSIPEFKDKKLYQQVFTHRSYLNEARKYVESNERLEFLGDSILSYVVSSFIFKEYNNLREGELTNLRSVLTNTQTFYKIGKMLNLGSRLKLSKGEEESGGRENKTILANTFEALIGGIYIDQGLEKAKEFIHNTLIAHKDEIVKPGELKDPKSTLQETLQAKHKISPVYKVTKEQGPDHSKIYTVGVYLKEKLLADGVGGSKQDAEKSAAQNALDALK